MRRDKRSTRSVDPKGTIIEMMSEWKDEQESSVHSFCGDLSLCPFKDIIELTSSLKHQIALESVSIDMLPLFVVYVLLNHLEHWIRHWV